MLLRIRKKHIYVLSIKENRYVTRHLTSEAEHEFEFV